MKKVLMFALFGFFVLGTGLTGCSKKKGLQPDDTYGMGGTGAGTVNFADEPSLRGDRERDVNLKTVYFEFDRSDLSPDALATLKENAAHILANPGLNVIVEGHCDERGTTEYNLALGQRRAVKVKEYYTQLGVKANRIATLSYGKEKPVDLRGNEASWAKNRRAETKVIAKN